MKVNLKRWELIFLYTEYLLGSAGITLLTFGDALVKNVGEIMFASALLMFIGEAIYIGSKLLCSKCGYRS